MNQAEKRELAKVVEAQGFHVGGLTTWPVRTTYYRRDGEAMPGLPADPESMKQYLAKGFTLNRPEKGTEIPAKVIASTSQPSRAVLERDSLMCSECSFTAKSDFGLLVHKRKHLKEKVNVIS